MKIVQGNLLDMFDNGDFNIIIHGANLGIKSRGDIDSQVINKFRFI